jgi:hypothetical protein
MHEGEILTGRSTYSDLPHWEPLLKLAPEIIDDFMWMFGVETEDGRRLQAYKHYWTRRYIHLDDTGCAFVYMDDDRYKQVGTVWLLDMVVRRSPLYPYEPDPPPDAEEVP